MIPARTGKGRLVDLENLPPSFDWHTEVAGPLSRIVRFAGQMPDDILDDPNVYSVAEHSVRGAEAIHAEALARVPDDVERADVLAFAFLMHDDHEALTGDATRPFVQLAGFFHGLKGHPGGQIRLAINKARDHVSAAFHRAAGLPWPLPDDIAAVVRDMDDRMCAAEQRHWWHAVAAKPDPALAHCAPVDIQDWRSPRHLDARPWSPATARGRWLSSFVNWRPAVRRTFGAGR